MPNKLSPEAVVIHCRENWFSFTVKHNRYIVNLLLWSIMGSHLSLLHLITVAPIMAVPIILNIYNYPARLTAVWPTDKIMLHWLFLVKVISIQLQHWFIFTVFASFSCFVKKILIRPVLKWILLSLGRCITQYVHLWHID